MKKTVLLLTIILAASLFISCGNKALKDDYGCFVNYEDALVNARKKKQPPAGCQFFRVSEEQSL